MRKILVSAYACEPFKGSEQGVGWNWVLQMSKNNEVHVITRSNNQEIIEANMPSDISKHLKFHYYDTHKLIKGLKNKAKGLYFYYFFWQIGIIPLIKRLKRNHKFDYSMHLTMGSIWMPTFLPLFNIPFIWGPIGGGEGVPKQFLKTLPVKNRIIQSLRNKLKNFSFLNPLIAWPSNHAVSIITRTNNTTKFIHRKHHKKVTICLETSMESDIFNYKRLSNGGSSPIKLISTGRLVPFKNIVTLIRATAIASKHVKVQLQIIGSGSEELNIKKEIKNLNLSDKVTFVKEVTREAVLEKLEQSDIYVFPSLREGGSWALMEAMAIGLPVICLNWTGMAIITDKNSAIQLPVSDPKQMSKDMADAIIKLGDCPELRLKMGLAARKRIKTNFNWDAKGVFMEELLTDLDKRNVQ